MEYSEFIQVSVWNVTHARLNEMAACKGRSEYISYTPVIK